MKTNSEPLPAIERPRARLSTRAAVLLALAAATFLAWLPFRRPADASTMVQETRDVLSTFVTITVVARDEAAGQKEISGAFALIERLQETLSAYDPASELARVNAQAARAPVQVSGTLFEAMQTGVDWHERTGGAFDITVRPLLLLWRNGAKEDRLPTESELTAARALLGAGRLRLDPEHRTVALPFEGMTLDLGGLGKGFIADRVVHQLQRGGVRNALVANAGDIYALGRRADGLPWAVGVQDPRRLNDPKALLTVLHLSNRAVSTSGNYERYVTIQNKRYSHIVDPRTGRTAENVPSVTVIGPDVTTTDILGTALSVLGVEDGLALIEKLPGVEAMFVVYDEEDRPLITRSSGFAMYEAKAR